MNLPAPRVALLVTCLVDFFRPTVGWASVKLLEDAGCKVFVPEVQTCCGQPAYNNGDRGNARAIARQVIDAFEDFDYIVVPSGSCAGMLCEHYPRLFEENPAYVERASILADKTFELIFFLREIMQVEGVEAAYNGTVTYHDSCSALRELKIKRPPRDLLRSVDGLTLKEMSDTDSCCGFGGTFCVKYPKISNKMVEAKTKAIAARGADIVLSADLGCLLNIAGKLKRDGSAVKVRHVAEVLADMTDMPPIGDKN
jgi:L-lactate dehydrogenase complex protein LldE